jgi:purine-binding chemotaxis protein CheW
MEKSYDYIVFTLDEKKFALLLDTLERVVRAVDITILPGLPPIVRGIINYKGNILPVFDIRPRFHLTQREIRPEDYFLIVNTAGRTIALMVDNVIDTMQNPTLETIAPIGELNETPFLSGIIKMADGIMLIPDLNNILTPPEDQALVKAMEEMTT